MKDVYKERAKKSIEATKKLYDILRDYRWNECEELLMEEALNYIKDAEYFYDNGDFFSSFGASDYAYGIMKALYHFIKCKNLKS